MRAWPDPWEPVTAEADKDNLASELRRELAPTHELYGRNCEAIGRSASADDVLFGLDGLMVAEVHLTWSGKQEPHPNCPATRIYSRFEDWAKEASDGGF